VVIWLWVYKNGVTIAILFLCVLLLRGISIMRSFVVSTLVLLATSAFALPQTSSPPVGSCADVHILVARASGEGKGEGMIGSLSKAIKAAVKGADSEAVDYPAALAPYGSSEIKGVKAAKDQLTAYVKRCPNSKMVLMGYSQVNKK
jgi:acetylxylan esterase